MKRNFLIPALVSAMLLTSLPIMASGPRVIVTVPGFYITAGSDGTIVENVAPTCRMPHYRPAPPPPPRCHGHHHHHHHKADKRHGHNKHHENKHHHGHDRPGKHHNHRR